MHETAYKKGENGWEKSEVKWWKCDLKKDDWLGPSSFEKCKIAFLLKIDEIQVY